MQHLIDTGDYDRILAQWGVETGHLTEALINEQPYQGSKLGSKQG